MSDPNRSRLPASAMAASPATILLVDDDRSVRQMVGRVLEAEGFTMLYASNGLEAMALVESRSVDLVVLDLNMPGQGGWDVFEQLSSKYPLIAVVVITARPNQLFTALGAGVGALLEKPLDFPTLIGAVKALLAEKPDERLARLAGRKSEFHYRPKDGASP